MQQRFFCTIPAPVLAISEMPPEEEKGRFPQQSICLRGLSANVMMCIGIFDWTSVVPMPIVIWCNATT
jgi:hypothetical protein